MPGAAEDWPLRERDGVQAALEQVLSSARDGGGRALFIVGEAGTGKSALMQQARWRAGTAMAVLSSDGTPMERDLPLAFAEQALGPLQPIDVAASGPTGAAGLARLAVVYAHAREQLRRRAAEGPLVLLLDDLHWADPDSISLLAFLARRISHLPVAVVGSMRPWPPAAFEAARTLSEQGWADIETLSELSEPAAIEVLSELSGGRPAEETARRAWELTNGNPLLVVEAARALAEGGDLPPNPEVAAGRPGEEGVTAVLSRMQSALLLRHLGGMSPDAVECAQAAAVLGRRVKVGVVEVVSGLSPERFAEAFDALVDAGVMHYRGAGWAEFRHELLATAIHHDTPAGRERLFHARAFAHLADAGDVTAASAHAVGAHLSGDQRVGRVLFEASARSIRDGAVQTGLAHLEAAIELAGPDPGPELLDRQADMLFVTGRPAEARAVLHRLVDRTADPEARRMLLARLAISQVYSGDLEEALANYDQLISGGEGSAGFRIRVALERCHLIWELQGPAAALASLDAAGLASAPDVPALEAGMLSGAYAGYRLHLGDPSGVEELRRQAEEARRGDKDAVGHRDSSFNAFLQHVVACGATERFEEAEEYIRVATDWLRADGALWRLPSFRIARLGLLVNGGAPMEALAEAADVEEELDPGPLLHPFILMQKARALSWIGRLEESAEVASLAAEMSAGRTWYVSVGLDIARSRALLAQARFDEAADVLESVEETLDRVGMVNPLILVWASGALTAMHEAGRYEAMARLADRLEDMAGRLSAVWPRMVALAGRAGLAAAGGDHERADALYRQALSLPVFSALDRAEVVLRYGSWLRRRGRSVDARPVLAEAVGIAERRGAVPLATRAREELAAAGGRRRAGRRRGGLTAQQARVAELAITGATTREIAMSLHLSPRTVENHLAAIYVALGVTSKAELRRRQAELDGLPRPARPAAPA